MTITATDLSPSMRLDLQRERCSPIMLTANL
jgi:hypothetical protein